MRVSSIPPTLPDEPGIYALIGICPRSVWLDLASLGRRWLEAGFYTYVGSAHGPGGIHARVGRHLSRSARLHWHIDFLRPVLRPLVVWHAPAHREYEHVWAEVLSRGRGIRVPVSGFGASDCACASHLFWSVAVPSFDSFKRRLRRRGRADLGSSSPAPSTGASGVVRAVAVSR